jgi:hypothetical protein
MTRCLQRRFFCSMVFFSGHKILRYWMTALSIYHNKLARKSRVLKNAEFIERDRKFRIFPEKTVKSAKSAKK